MKKFFLTMFSLLFVLGSILAYILYTEGAFDKRVETPKTELKPFIMKCEAGKCGSAKCGEGK